MLRLKGIVCIGNNGVSVVSNMKPENDEGVNIPLKDAGNLAIKMLRKSII